VWTCRWRKRRRSLVCLRGVVRLALLGGWGAESPDCHGRTHQSRHVARNLGIDGPALGRWAWEGLAGTGDDRWLDMRGLWFVFPSTFRRSSCRFSQFLLFSMLFSYYSVHPGFLFFLRRNEWIAFRSMGRGQENGLVRMTRRRASGHSPRALGSLFA